MAHEEFRQHGSVNKALAHLIEETGEVLAAAGGDPALWFGLLQPLPSSHRT